MPTDKKKLVVIDIDMPNLLKNRVFQPALSAPISHTLLPLSYLFEEAKKRGIDMVTPDVFLSMDNKPSHTLCISYLHTSFTQTLISAGVHPTIIVCQESPFIATRFYVGLKKYTKQYAHAFVFAGMKKRLHKKTTYHQMHFPSSFDTDTVELIPFEAKKFATMVVSNKGAVHWSKNILLQVIYGRDAKQLYAERKTLLDYFSGDKEFDLYGRGWNTNLEHNVKKIYRGEVTGKHATIQQYKFVFAYENARFQGYVTEKIFDVMFAGSVPVYMGAPDITTYVPKECFIAREDFADYDALHTYLQNMDSATYEQYISNIQKYIVSDQYQKFSQERFSKQMLSIIEEEFISHE